MRPGVLNIQAQSRKTTNINCTNEWITLRRKSPFGAIFLMFENFVSQTGNRLGIREHLAEARNHNCSL